MPFPAGRISFAPFVLASAITLILAGVSVPLGQAEPAEAATLPRVRFVAPPGGSILVHGTYPTADSPCLRPVQPVVHSRHAGVIEVGRAEDGTLFVLAELPFERYVEGIAEMPRTWPLEALKAQAVAARSYALARLGAPDETAAALGYQICGSAACQVYRGLAVAEGPYGVRWRTAVQDTAGQVLLHGGRPATTLYFSTSNGRTYGNDEVFGTDPLPYLRPIAEEDDAGAPLASWRAQIPFTDVARFLRAAGEWPAGRPVTAVRRQGPVVIVAGGGMAKRFGILDFRSALNFWAPCLAPDRFPTVSSNGLALPQTVPSRWFGTTTVKDSVVLDGRGWGHGVGMVQWGAYGKAIRGLAYDDILAGYYGGLRPEIYPAPALIRVGIATGLTSIQVEGTEGVIVDGAEPGSGPGPWLITGGGRLAVGPGQPPPASISPAAIEDAPANVRAGHGLTVDVDVPQLSVASLALRTPDGEVRISEPETRAAGRATLAGMVPDGLATGTYDLVAVLTDGADIVTSVPHVVAITGTASPSAEPTTAEPTSPAPSSTSAPTPASGPVARPEAPNGGPPTPLVVFAALAVTLVLAAGAFAVARRRGDGSGPGAWTSTSSRRPTEAPHDGVGDEGWGDW